MIDPQSVVNFQWTICSKITQLLIASEHYPTHPNLFFRNWEGTKMTKHAGLTETAQNEMPQVVWNGKGQFYKPLRRTPSRSFQSLTQRISVKRPPCCSRQSSYHIFLVAIKVRKISPQVRSPPMPQVTYIHGQLIFYIYMNHRETKSGSVVHCHLGLQKSW